MLKNYFKIGLRNLLKDKLFTLLNIIGLSVAFAVAILLSMAAFFDLSFDRFHEHADTIYEVYRQEQSPKGPEASTSQPAPLAGVLKSEVPSIKKVSRHLQQQAVFSFKEKQLSLDVVWVDEDFFNIFTFPVSSKRTNQILADQSSIAITEATAQKLFGESNPLGKTVHVLIEGSEEPFTVGTVISNIPEHSSLKFEAALRFEKHPNYQENKESWDTNYHSIFVQMDDKSLPDQFEKSTRSLVDLNYVEDIANMKRDGVVANSDGRFIQFKLLALEDIHFVNFRKGYAEVSRNTVFLILAIAFLIIGIACVNFINMSVAKSSQRMREIGMRKTLGAQKRHLFFQFWSESLVVFIIAVGIGAFLSALLLDDFKTLFKTAVSFDIIRSPKVILSFIGFILFITLLVGGYPALLLSKLNVIQSLKGKLEKSGKNRVRNALMIIQFAIAIILISSTIVLREQLYFMRNKDLGFNKEQVISFPLDGKKDGYQVLDLLRNELKGNPDILSVSGADNNLGIGRDGSRFRSIFGFEYKNRIVKTNFLAVDYDYLETLDVKLVEGRGFKRGFASDSLSVVINEAMARELGEKDPLTAYVQVNDSTNYPVIGVIKDYNFDSLDNAIAPLTLFLNKDYKLYYGYVKVAPKNLVKSLDAIKSAWASIEPNSIFLGSFLDENINRTLKKEEKMTTIISAGSLIAIALSCIGLFAISLLMVAQRTKEIGVRKVIGASVSSITYLLTKDFLKLVTISFLIAAPVAWWLMSSWLKEYPFKIELKAWFFIIAGLVAFGIAILTVGSRTIKAAMQNPVDSLRAE